MKNILIRNLGRIVHMKDYVLTERTPSGTIYKQTNDPSKTNANYNKRIIGMHKTPSGMFVVGVAVGSFNDKNLTSDSGLAVVISRIMDLVTKSKLNMTPLDKGVSMFDYSHRDLMTDDPAAYSNILGPIHPDSMDIAISTLNNLELKFYRKQRADAYAIYNLQQRKKKKQ